MSQLVSKKKKEQYKFNLDKKRLTGLRRILEMLYLLNCIKESTHWDADDIAFSKSWVK